MKKFLKYLYPVLPAVIVLLVVRGLLFSHIRLPEKCVLPGVRTESRHAFVSLTYYGLRLPGESLIGYHRWGYRTPRRGEVVVFNLPLRKGVAMKPGDPVSPGDLSVGVCRGLPGDTVWIDPMRKKYLPGRTSPDAQPIVIPGRKRPTRVTESNCRLLAYIMQQYEGSHVSTGQRGKLRLDGVDLGQVRFTHDYYWVETAPDVFLLVPHEALIGKALIREA